MEYFRELIGILKSKEHSPLTISDDMAKSCIRVIEHCEKIEKEFNEKLDKDILNKFNNYRTMLHFIVDGLLIDETCNMQAGLILVQHNEKKKK